MEHQFWHDKWQSNEIGFHQRNTNPWLIRHLDKLPLPVNGHWFLPLCGKTRDIDWLIQQGFQVSGCELNESAVTQLFSRLDLQPTITTTAQHRIYRTRQLTVWVGDVFELTAGDLGHVDAVFDRAALVALPEHMRPAYASHITMITASAPQLLICFEYQQSLMSGPPFSVPAQEVMQLYKDHDDIKVLSQADVPGGLKGHCAATEVCWLLN